MGNQETASLIRAVYAAYARGDMPGVFDGLSDDIAWTSNCAGGALCWGGSFRGKAGVSTYFERVGGSIAVEGFDVLDMIVQDDRAAVRVRLSVRFLDNGRTLAAEKVDLLTVAGGRITSFSEYYDTALVERTMTAD